MSAYRCLQIALSVVLFLIAIFFKYKAVPKVLDRYKSTVIQLSIFFGIAILLVVTRKFFYVTPVYIQMLAFVSIGIWYLYFLDKDFLLFNIVNKFSKEHLAYIRVIVCLSLLLLVYLHDITTTLIVPIDYIEHYPPLSYIFQNFSVLSFVRSYDFLWWLRTACFVFLGLSIVGIKTRLSLIFSAISYTIFYYIMIMYTHFFHSGFMALQLLYILVFLPCGDALSVDSLRKKRFFSKEVYGYSVLILISSYALFYLATGLSKLYVDPFWANQYNLKKFILEDCLDMIGWFDMDLVAKYIQAGYSNKIFIIMGLIGLLTELLAPLMLFIPQFIWITPLSILFLHIGIFFTQEFFFEDAILLSFGLLLLIFLKFKTLSKPEIEVVSVSSKKNIFKLRFIKYLGASWAALIITAWVCGWHYFPISSAWGMYAVDTNRTEGASYSKVYLVTNDSTRIRTDLTDHITFAIDGKWRNLTEHPRNIKSEYHVKLKKLFNNYAPIYNKDKVFDKQINHVEIELWLWWHFTNPLSPTFGEKRDDVIKVYLDERI